MLLSAPSSLTRGQQAEELACLYLCRQGLKLVERNYRTPRGEIDLVMQDAGSMVFVEVRYRQTARFGGAAASVDFRKQAKLIAAASHYLQQHPPAARQPSRFDVIAISAGQGPDQVQWIKHAFQT